MLINDFFTINELNTTAEIIDCSIKINASHKIFNGHFPDNPITPGVVQIQIVKEILEKALEKEFIFKEMGRCKFLAILNPTENSEIEITIKFSKEEETDLLKISAQGMSKDKNTTFFKFNAKYAA